MFSSISSDHLVGRSSSSSIYNLSKVVKRHKLRRKRSNSPLYCHSYWYIYCTLHKGAYTSICCMERSAGTIGYLFPAMTLKISLRRLTFRTPPPCGRGGKRKARRLNEIFNRIVGKRQPTFSHCVPYHTPHTIHHIPYNIYHTTWYHTKGF